MSTHMHIHDCTHMIKKYKHMITHIWSLLHIYDKKNYTYMSTHIWLLLHIYDKKLTHIWVHIYEYYNHDYIVLLGVRESDVLYSGVLIHRSQVVRCSNPDVDTFFSGDQDT